MPGFIQHDRAPSRKSADGGAAEHRTEARGSAPAEDALGVSLNRGARSQSLVQMRQALDGSPRVQALSGMERALNPTREPEDKEAEQLPQDARPATMQFAARPDDPPPSTPVQNKPNDTGLPDHLKDGVEQLSGLAMDDVRVHYNSEKPAAVQAHAYAQGTDIHVAPGQEQHLPHEAWHVVQQKQGRVKPTLQLKGVAVNDDAGLEREADAMGRQAAGTVRPPNAASAAGDQRMEFSSSTDRTRAATRSTVTPNTIQRIFSYGKNTYGKNSKKLPTSKLHGAKKKHLRLLADSEEKYELDGKTKEQIAAWAKQEEKKQAVDYAQKNRDTVIERFKHMEPHMAGELKGTGGHLLLSMIDKHGDKLHYTGEGKETVWETEWGILKKPKATKQQEDTEEEEKIDVKKEIKKKQEEDVPPKDHLEFFPLKRSTMFPASWTWNVLLAKMGAFQRDGNRLVLEGGIEVEYKGGKDGTFYPVMPGGGGDADDTEGDTEGDIDDTEQAEATPVNDSAKSYIEENDLDVKLTYDSVNSYCFDKQNDWVLRLGLANAWNIGGPGQFIATKFIAKEEQPPKAAGGGDTKEAGKTSAGGSSSKTASSRGSSSTSASQSSSKGKKKNGK